MLLHTFSVGVFSFVGHFNILPVYRSLARSLIAPTDATAHADADAGHADAGALDDDDAAPKPTDHPAGDQSADRAERSAIASAAPRRAMGAALIVAFAVAFTVYATLGVLGALTFGPDTSDDALADYSRTPFGRACRFMLAAAMLATYPLFSHEPLVFLRQLHAYTVRHVSRHVSNALHRSTADRDDASPAPLGTPTAALLEPPRGRSRPRGELGEQSTAASIIGGALWVGATAAGALLAADAGKVLCARPARRLNLGAISARSRRELGAISARSRRRCSRSSVRCAPRRSCASSRPSCTACACHVAALGARASHSPGSAPLRRLHAPPPPSTPSLSEHRSTAEISTASR